MRIGIDLDGVLCDFTKSYNALVKAHLGIDLPHPATTWDYHLDAGMTREQSNQMWEIIKTTPFQGTMLPLPGALEAIERLNVLSLQGNDIYFITSRTGKLAKFWSELWLRNHGMDYPTVLVAKDKGHVAVGLQLEVFVDDKPENNMDVVVEFNAENQQRTTRPLLKLPRIYLPTHPYNEWATDGATYGVRVADLNEALEREFPREKRRAA